MTDVVTFSDNFAEDEDSWSKSPDEYYTGGHLGLIQEPQQPWLCPHCRRDRHPEPLTTRAANMLDGMKLDPGYDAAADDSPIVCIGSDYHGPRRYNEGFPNRVVIGGLITPGGGIIHHTAHGMPGGHLGIVIFPDVSGLKQSLLDTLEKMTSGFADIAKSFTDLPPLTLTFKPWFPGDPPPPCALPDTLPVITFGPPYPIKQPKLMQFPTIKTLVTKEQITKAWWPTIRKAVNLDAITFELPPTPGYDFTTLTATLENNHPTEGKSHEGQRIPRRSPRRNRHPLHPRHDAQRGRRRM
jgi:hypothetical protein